MATVTHTPGPWKVLEVGGRPKLCPADENNQSILTIVEEDGVRFAAVLEEADARLIAAAPDLYAELNNLIAKLDRGVFIRSDLKQAQAAIAKAEGRS